MSTVYLAGPIAGTTYKECVDWREHAILRLAVMGSRGLSPMRNKTFLAKEATMGMTYEHPLSTARGITTRDHFDVRRCDVVLVNFLGAERVSIGTVMEVAWAKAYGKPVVMAIGEDDFIHQHPMIMECTDYMLPSIDEAIDTVLAVLGGI